MKTKLMYYALLVATMVVSVSCSSDKDEVTKTSGKLTIDGDEFNLTKGFVRRSNGGYIGPNGIVFSHTILLTSEEIDFDGQFTFTGRGALAVFDVYSLVDGEITEGTFNFEKITENEPFFFDYYDANGDYDFDNPVGNEDESTDGVVTIKRSGEKYTITFAMEMKDGTTETGSYTGPLVDILD